MKKKSAVVAGAVLLLLVAAVPFLYAAGHSHHGEHEWAMFGRMQALRHELDLSDAQVSQLKTIREELKTQNAPYRDQLHAGLKSIATTLLANPNDLTSAQALLDQQDAAERAMKTNTLHAAAKALNVLTPDQRSKLGTVREKHYAGMLMKHEGRESGRE